MYHANDKYSCLIIKLAALVLGIVLFYFICYTVQFRDIKRPFVVCFWRGQKALHFVDYDTLHFSIFLK